LARRSLFGAAVLVWRGGPCLARRSLFGAAVLVWRDCALSIPHADFFWQKGWTDWSRVPIKAEGERTMKGIVALLLALPVLLTNGAGGQKAGPATQTAHVHVYRPAKKMWGRALSSVFYCDDDEIAPVSRGKYFDVEVPAADTCSTTKADSLTERWLSLFPRTLTKRSLLRQARIITFACLWWAGRVRYT